MTRVEWTRLEGNDVEAVVAMFVNRERPNSVRITPSRGDGGVDILDRGAGTDGGDEVHQVKRYSDPLTPKQQNEVEKSLVRLKSDPRWKELNVTTWYLVTPWDPTPEAEKWLHELGADHQVNAVWRGLAYVEGLATKYPEVVDYYLHDGRNRVEEIYQKVTALLGLGTGHDGLSVPAAIDRIKLAVQALDIDPHYRYELRFGEGDFAGHPSRPGLVMTQMSGDVNGGPWAAVDIVARCAASVHERPITISGTISAESGSDFEGSLRDFVAFGAPFSSPDGAYSGEIDAPGGLGGPLKNARVATLPIDGDLGDNPSMHVQVIDPAGEVIASADLNRTERSQGTDGVRVVLEETHHVFTVEDRFNLKLQTSSRSLRFGQFAGQPATAVLRAFKFVASCKEPNVARLSLRDTPPERGLLDPRWSFPMPAEMERELRGTIHTLELLAIIQSHTSVPVRVPDFDSLPADQLRSWRVAAKLFSGDDVIFTYPEGDSFTVDLETSVVIPEGPIGISLPFVLHVGEQKIDLGGLEAWLESPTIIDRTESDGQVSYSFTTPDRTGRYRWAGEDSAQ